MSEQLTIIGTVKIIFDMVQYDSGFQKREFVITTPGEYPNDIKFECIKDKCNMLNGLDEGDNVKVYFNVRGNEYKERYYVNLLCWKFEKGEQAAVQAEPEQAPEPAQTAGADASEDFPFKAMV